MHSASEKQLIGHSADPLQTSGPHEGLAPDAPGASTVQVPGVASQTSQPWEHADSQHTPSTQWPLAHASLSTPHGSPIFSLQVPTASQVLMPLQVSSSSTDTTLVQVPGTSEQVSQAPLHAEPQQ